MMILCRQPRILSTYLLAISLVAVITIVGLSRLAVAAFSAHKPDVTKANTVTPIPYGVSQPGSKIEVEVVTLRATGFDPVTLMRSKGPFLLVIQNRCGLNEVTFRFDKSVGARLQAARIPQKKSRWSDVVDLPPGTYTMTEATRPDWSLKLIITPNT